MRSKLEVVARLRELEERRALGVATRALHALLEAEGRSDVARRAYDERPQPQAEITPAVLMSLRTQGMGALEIVAEASAKVSEAAHVRESAARAATAASVRRKSTDRLVERKAAEAAAEAAFVAQREADEHTVLRYKSPSAGVAK